MSHTDSRLLSYFRFTVWWLGQRLPMEGILWTSLFAAVCLLVAWGLVPLYLWHIARDHDVAMVMNTLRITPRIWMGICWTMTALFTVIALVLICRLLVLQYKQFYDRYNIPGIRW